MLNVIKRKNVLIGKEHKANDRRCEYYKRHEEINKTMAWEGGTLYEIKQKINIKDKVKEREGERVEEREEVGRLRNMNIRKRNELNGSTSSNYISNWSEYSEGKA